MRVKQLVSKHLKSIGVAAKKNELGLIFTFEGWDFLLWDDAEDPLFFRLVLPGVFDVTDENFAKAIMACNKVNWNFKVVKAVLCEFEDKHDNGASVWMCFEKRLDDSPQIDELIPHAARSLIAAADAFDKEMMEG